MPRIFDFGGRDVERAQTVAGLRALRSAGRQAAQVTAETADEAAAAEAAGVEMVVCRAANVGRVREGSQRVFVTAALGFAEAVTADDILRTAFTVITGGADAVLTSRGSETVRALAHEQIPVVGHLGFVPRKSTWVGGVRAVGKSATEALQLWDRFQRLEDAGAFAAECELIAAPVTAEIHLARPAIRGVGAIWKPSIRPCVTSVCRRSRAFARRWTQNRFPSAECAGAPLAEVEAFRARLAAGAG